MPSYQIADLDIPEGGAEGITSPRVAALATRANEYSAEFLDGAVESCATRREIKIWTFLC
jgi:hypothetical protein